VRVACVSCGAKTPARFVVCLPCWGGMTEKRRDILLYLRLESEISADLIRAWLGGTTNALRTAFALHNPAFDLWLLEDPALAEFFFAPLETR